MTPTVRRSVQGSRRFCGRNLRCVSAAFVVSATLLNLQCADRAMAQATGTLAGLNEFLSDTPTDIEMIALRATLIANAISTLANELTEKLQQTPGPIDRQLQEQALAQIEPLNRELERLLEIKHQLEASKR
jgi:hypothetical protein